VRTALRHGDQPRDDRQASLRGPRGLWHTTIRWDELDRMRLAYYSTRRDRRSGWMQLDLSAGAARVPARQPASKALTRFVRHAAHVAAARGLGLTEATMSNLEALGIAPARGPMPMSGAAR